MTQARLTAWVHGRVQGVGFRWWTRSRALELGLAGYAANQADGEAREGAATGGHGLRQEEHHADERARLGIGECWYRYGR